VADDGAVSLLPVVACAWVLWTVRAEAGQTVWEPVRGYPTVEECRQAELDLSAVLLTVPDFARFREAKVTCLPERTDPRRDAR
jgi:hypothetical protein